MSNSEIPKESPEDIAHKIAELRLATEEDKSFKAEDPEAEKNVEEQIAEFEKQLLEQVSGEQSSKLIKRAREEIIKNSDLEQAT
jgi:hypothetical protein